MVLSDTSRYSTSLPSTVPTVPFGPTLGSSSTGLSDALHRNARLSQDSFEAVLAEYKKVTPFIKDLRVLWDATVAKSCHSNFLEICRKHYSYRCKLEVMEDGAATPMDASQGSCRQRVSILLIIHTRKNRKCGTMLSRSQTCRQLGRR